MHHVAVRLLYTITYYVMQSLSICITACPPAWYYFALDICKDDIKSIQINGCTIAAADISLHGCRQQI